MHRDYFFDDEVLSSTGYTYKNEPINALKQMADYYKENF